MSRRTAARPWLAPLVPLYRLGLFAREAALRAGLEPVRRLRWPVVSIGNLSTGGAGKTPLTIALAQAFTRCGLHVDVLSRGYGRRSTSAARVDPEGTAEAFGDEPILIAREAGVPAYVAAERYQAGLLAEVDGADRPAGIHLLDDGFQHRQLHRDVNILLLDAGTWFDERLLPAGNLREPLAAMRRAGVLAIPAREAESLESSLRNRGGWSGPIWHLQRTMDVPSIEGPVIAFCGIARPEQFFEGLRRAGLSVAHCVAFPDHHRYQEAGLARLRDLARHARAAAFVTTEKDRVRLGELANKLAESCPLQTARLRIEIDQQNAAIEWLMGRLSSCLPASQA
ncbi:MAG TPA: tetraacyldisaccharide 4'-kinase [Terracidiphilus sp.]|jgi:tetraacyldisaccharide 4'-kinase